MIEYKQQTALEWYDNEIEKLFNQFTIDKINIYEFRTKRLKLLEKAKAIDKGQRQHTFEQSRLNNKFVGLKYESFEQYYNETFGGKQ
jgi:hypothetical protein